ncbi:PAAR domain-containing protein [Burkholderia sp. Bp9004]|uniref:PAAR domain-containing protein n=1 Tax=Burkholderia sp. Bp9004 TaxID=2184559 RepID=UPI000F60376B|nr:PAAR domain-containing protein [Burkholderia sp. Bp9004]RQZ70131.1 PAAR domain-containing protein [Burkholderia sp. Bp9004]
MKRNYLRVGDHSSTGGTVVDGIPTTECLGRQMTYVGAKVVCPACKQMGVIVANGPRWPGSMMGLQPALEGDKVACRCSPLPTMLASQASMFVSFESEALSSMGFTSSGEQMALNPGTPQPSEGFCLSCMIAAAKNAAAMIVRG